MGGRGERRVIGRRREGVVRKRRRRGRRREGGVGSRTLRIPVRLPVVVVLVVVRVGSRHLVGLEAWHPRRVGGVALVGVLARRRVVPVGDGVALARLAASHGRPHQHAHIRAALTPSGAASLGVRMEAGRRGIVVRRVMGRRHVGGRNGRWGSGADGLGLRGRHHLGLHVMHHALVGQLALGPTPRVGVAVYPRVARELVRTGKALGAARELACMGLLSCVRPDVPRLVFETVEGLVAEGALVGSGELVGVDDCLAGWGQRPVGSDHAY